MPAGPGPEGNFLGPWFAIPVSGTVQKQTNPVLAAALGATAVGFKTEAAADAYANGHSIAHGSSPGGQAVGGIKTATDFLTSSSTWIRVGEVIAGLILVAIGVNAMLKGNPTYSAATKGAAGAAKMVGVL